MATNTNQSSEKESNIVKFKKKQQLNIGIIIFGIIFIYLVATVVMYITAPHITIYEVRQGSILKDTAYTGLAIRDEIVVNATESGYINYYVQDGSKVKVGSNIYTLSSDKLVFDDLISEKELELTSEEERTITRRIEQFNHDYQEGTFLDTYHFKEELKGSLGTMSSHSRLDQLTNLLSQGTVDEVSVYSAADDGVVIYSVDGMEGLTIDTATVNHLDKSNYKKIEFANNSRIQSGDSIYKIITDDEWTLMVELNEETANLLKEKQDVKVHFTKDDQTLWASFTMKTIDGRYVAYLTFQNSMVRYASERYLDIELILEDETGLKWVLDEIRDFSRKKEQLLVGR